MQEELENMDPNEPDLAEVIRQNINHQRDLNNKRTLLKESMIKISLDKDLQNLFDVPKTHSATSTQRENTKTMFQATEEIKDVCQWLEESQEFSGLAYVPFQSMPRLLHILHQKVQGTAIVVTEYPTFWINKMQELGRLSKLRWGVLSSNQQAQDKVKVLELYQLKKLKLLFITPNLFKCQEYHEFECDLLVINDLHLYHHHLSLVDRLIAKTNPSRVLTIHHTLMHDHYAPILDKFRMSVINKPKTTNHNFIILKTTKEDKFRNMINYLSKGEYKRILIVVNKKQEASALNKVLLMQSKTSVNLYDYLNPTEMNNYTVQDKLQKMEQEKQEQRIFQFIKRISNTEIVIGKNTDFLRFCNFDIAIYYSFTDVIKFVQSCFTTKQKLLLFEQNDYHNYRNTITSQFVTMDYLQKVVMDLVQKPLKKEQKSKKRFYSDCIEENLMNCYSVCKQYAQKDEEKVIRMNAFCKKNQISSRLLTKIIDALHSNGVIGINYRTIFQIEIDIDSIARMKRQLPMIEEVRRKVNLLNESTSLQKTIRTILDQLKREQIKYKITQEAIQIKILRDYEDIDWQNVLTTVNQPASFEAMNLDRSFDTFKECAYSSIELTRREKALQKKQILLDFFKNNAREMIPSFMESYHRSNLLTSQIQEWIRHKEQITITDHQLVLLLQGVQKGKLAQFKEDPIYGRYRHLKYQELMQAVTRIYSQKKVKLE